MNPGKLVSVSVLLVWMTVVIVSCSGDENGVTPPPGGQQVSFATQVQPIFTASCAVPGCHVPGGSAPFSLASGSSRGNLVDQPATTSSCSFLRVKPFVADSSVLYRRISGTSCGAQMPLGRTPISSSSQQLIRDWINQGALNN